MSREGDIQALVTAHSKWLSAFLRGLAQCEADAEDAFQDVWVRVIRSGGLEKVSSPRAYLAQIARRVLIDRYRRQSRYAESLDVVDASGLSAGERIVDESPAADCRVEARDLHDDVLSMVRALAPGPRQVVLMRVEGELTFQAIADELKVPLGTVLTWMRTATQQLRKRLDGGNGRRS